MLGSRLSRKNKIKYIRNISSVFCVAGIFAIAFSTSIISILTVTVVTAGIGYYGNKKIKALNKGISI